METKNYLLFDILFPVLHGGLGENGAMQGLFEMMNIPFVGCGILASAVSMNKLLLHQYAEKLGIKKKTLRNAKMELGIDSVKRGNQWYWMLSE